MSWDFSSVPFSVLRFHRKYQWPVRKSHENPEIIEILLKSGANVNDKDQSGITPLFFSAANNKNPDIVELLIKYGAKINERDNYGRTPLIAATNNLNPEVMIVLLKNGADVTLKDSDGRNVLDYIEEKPIFRDTPIYSQIKEMLSINQ